MYNIMVEHKDKSPDKSVLQTLLHPHGLTESPITVLIDFVQVQLFIQNKADFLGFFFVILTCFTNLDATSITIYFKKLLQNQPFLATAITKSP